MTAVAGWRGCELVEGAGKEAAMIVACMSPEDGGSLWAGRRSWGGVRSMGAGLGQSSCP